MKQRDIWKEKAKNLARLSPVVGADQVAAWGEYKQYRNKIKEKRRNNVQIRKIY